MYRQVDSLKIAIWNVRGLVSKRNYKLKDPLFIQSLQENDIFMLCETWTNDNSVMNIPGYEYVALHRKRHPRARRDSGGIAIYYRENMAKYVTILKSSGDCLQWVQINKDFYSGDKDILLCMCYAVPLNSRVGGTCNIFECLSNDLIDFTNTFENLYVPFIAGDFNARIRDENEIAILSDDDNFTEIPIRTSSDKKPLNSSGTDLIELCKEAL